MDDSAHYTVLARRFRPQTFADVVGQAHVARALQNAIRAGRVAHAYLFTGARGVGKTSMARIFAKALNCPNAVDGIPCNDCEICKAVTAGHDVDVVEIDGASNRGIDDIRSLRANASIKSMRTRYKMYIIDEVHMLTKEAFNALLKTLEEPPPNVKFVFCTTEPNKVPDTILSRCQRFDFASIEESSIVERLKQIAEIEGYQVDDESLSLVGRRAAGSMRDSQSLFDQLLAFGEERITAADVHRLWGTAPDDRLIDIADALIERRRENALELLDAAVSDGVQLSELTEQLLAYARDLMVIAAEAESLALTSVSGENRSKLAAQAQAWGLRRIVAAMQILAEAKTRMFRASFARTLLELALVRIVLLDDLDSLSELVAELKSGQPGNRPATAPAAPGTPGGSRPPVAKTAPPPRPAPPPAEKKTSLSETPNAPAVPQPAAELPRVELVAGSEQEFLSQLLANLDDKTRNYLQKAEPSAISGPNQLDLTFPRSYSFNKTFCEKPESLGKIERLASQIAGQPVKVSIRVAKEATEPVANPAKVERRIDQNTSDDFVERAKTVFGATVVKVEGIPSRQE